MSKLAHDWDKYCFPGYGGNCCGNCIHHIEMHSVPINSKEPVKIKHLCTRDGTFGTSFEVDPKEFCDFFMPRTTQPPKDDKLEIVYHGHTVVLSNTTDGIRVEIKEKKDE